MEPGGLDRVRGLWTRSEGKKRLMEMEEAKVYSVKDEEEVL